MKRLLVVVVLLVVAVVGLGFYLGFFRFSSTGTDDKTNITITVDQEKIKEGKEKVQEKAEELGREIKERTSTPTSKAKEDRPKP
jgi:hypothetical protein